MGGLLEGGGAAEVGNVRYQTFLFTKEKTTRMTDGGFAESVWFCGGQVESAAMGVAGRSVCRVNSRCMLEVGFGVGFGFWLRFGVCRADMVRELLLGLPG